MGMLTVAWVTSHRRLRSTAVHGFVDQPPEAVNVDENERATPALDYAVAFERLELACDSFATRAYVPRFPGSYSHSRNENLRSNFPLWGRVRLLTLGGL